MPESTQIPVMQEHQSAKDMATGPAGYQPTAEERQTIKLANRLYEQAKKHREKYDRKWLDYYRMFRGRQWSEARPSYRHSEVINLVFQAIQSQVPILSDSRPKIEFLPQEPNDLELAQILNEVAESDWEKNSWFMQLVEIIYDSKFYGTGFGCMKWEENPDTGLGEPVFASSDPFHCFPDPSATDVNTKAQYFVYAEPVEIDKLKSDYPDKKEFIKPDLTDLNYGDKTNLDQVRFKSPVDNRTLLEGQSQYDLGNQNKALKITVWEKSNEFFEEEILGKDSNGNETKEYEQKLKYPKGRKICVSNGVLLEDSENPYEDRKFPYAKLINYVLPREFWGISEVEQLEGPQKVFNKLISFALDVLTLMGNPVWVISTDSGLDTDNIMNRPGMILEPEPGARVDRMEGVQLQPYVLQLVDRMKLWFDDISGTKEVSRGSRPEGVNSGIAITALQEASQTRLRLQARNIDAFMQDIGQMYLSRTFQFLTAPRVYRLTNKDGSQRFFKMHVEPIDEYGGKVVKVRDTGGQEVVYQTQGKFDVRVTTGSSLPFSKEERIQKALALFDRKVIDEEEVLKSMDYPNYEAILQRLRERQMALAQEAQLQNPVS